ncbi:MAG: SpoIID/LytB domain-containing protein [Acidimicrobiales bacterium]
MTRVGAARAALLTLALALLAGGPGPAARAGVADGAQAPFVVIDGRGDGHGVGMAQEGARTMAAAGASTPDILSQFYPGTTPSTASGTVRVTVLAGGGPTTVVAFPAGGQVTDDPGGHPGAGFPVSVPPGGRVSITLAGGHYRAQVAGPDAPVGPSPGLAAFVAPPAGAASTTTTTTAPSTTTSTTRPPATTAPTTATTVAPAPPAVAPPAGAPAPTTTMAPAPPPAADATRSLWAVPAPGGSTTVEARDRTYRGLLQAAAAPDGTSMTVVDQVGVEDYLRGMGEIRDPGWPAAALRAQAIAARTYALRAVAGGGTLCDDDHCQVYLGRTAEYGAMDAAVAATAGQVLTYGGALADTVYSANGGGVSATPEEGFGTDGSGTPYLRSAPYATDDPGPWTVRLSADDVAARLGYAGLPTALRVTRTGPSGRALEVAVDGPAGTTTVDGITAAARLGLRSTLFTVRPDETPAAPAAPGAGGGGQPGAAAPGSPTALSGPPHRAVPADAAGSRSWWPVALLAATAAALVATGRRWKGPAGAPVPAGAGGATARAPAAGAATPSAPGRGRPVGGARRALSVALTAAAVVGTAWEAADARRHGRARRRR